LCYRNSWMAFRFGKKGGPFCPLPYKCIKSSSYIQREIRSWTISHFIDYM
jgi:hypothetical protein